MAESAVAFLLNQLSTWLREEQKLLGGLRNEAQIVHDDLQQMRALLRGADATEETDPKLKAFVKQVRQITYDMEDLLESYMLLSGSRTRGDGCIKKFYASIRNLKGKHKLASEIKALRSRLQHAFKTFNETAIVLPGSSSSAFANDAYYDGRGDALLLAEADVVGIEGPKKQLLQWIGTADYTLKVISVVGMAGLGKTTLVKKIYDDPSVQGNIEHHAWITISNTYKVENVLLDLIKQLLEEVKAEPPPRLESMKIDGMKEYIHKFLQNKKYLIVLDDVWSKNVWEALQCAFPSSSTHGRGCIIMTTRKDNIGHIACCESGDHVYKLEPLPPQKAKELFHKKIFSGGSCPDDLKEMSECILKRCAGLPLAIVVIGGVLATKRNKIEEWTKFSLNFESEVEDDDLKRVWKLLSLSYYDLPYYLKICLLYLSIFPEDKLIEKATIIRLWITEGFVEAKAMKTMEEIAEGYLNELSNKNLIQVAKNSEDGRPRNFRVHDLIREYIISKAREQNIVGIKGSSEIILEDKIRRIVLDNSSTFIGEKINNLKYLRSLLFIGFSSEDLQWGQILCKILRGNCRMLRLLDLRGAPLDLIPNEVFKLYHLKYLSLRDTNVSLIPKLIGNLIKLEVLDLKGSKVVKLPIEILKLRRLRYLLVYEYFVGYNFNPSYFIQSFEAPYEIGELLCLQKLCYIDASAVIVKEIGKLTKLRRLGITKVRKEHGKELCSSLANLTRLNSLFITVLDEGEVIDLQYSMPPSSLQFLRSLALQGQLEVLPQWITSLKALTKLRMASSKLKDEDQLEYLQQGLPNLQVLKLADAFEGERLSFKSGSFPRLTKLSLVLMRGLRWVCVEKGSMPCLNTLYIGGCKAIMELPEGIEHLTNVNRMKFYDMADEFLEKLFEERTREDHQRKLAHVPTITVAYWLDGEVKRRLL